MPDSPAERLVKAGRYASEASTRLARAVERLRRHSDETVGEPRWYVGYEAERLIAVALFELPTLVPALNDDADLDRLEQEAHLLYKRLRARRLAQKLSMTEGRTADEAAAFLAKAGELRRDDA